jgi:hypothetical protein
MLPAVFEPAVSVGDRPRTLALDRSATRLVILFDSLVLKTWTNCFLTDNKENSSKFYALLGRPTQNSIFFVCFLLHNRKQRGLSKGLWLAHELCSGLYTRNTSHAR